jgi:hypothetical protein
MALHLGGLALVRLAPQALARATGAATAFGGTILALS